jgi:hypothetical protein
MSRLVLCCIRTCIFFVFAHILIGCATDAHALKNSKEEIKIPINVSAEYSDIIVGTNLKIFFDDQVYFFDDVGGDIIFCPLNSNLIYCLHKPIPIFLPKVLPKTGEYKLSGKQYKYIAEYNGINNLHICDAETIYISVKDISENKSYSYTISKQNGLLRISLSTEENEMIYVDEVLDLRVGRFLDYKDLCK